MNKSTPGYKRSRLPKALAKFRREEKGFAEVAAAIFVLPILIAFIFTLIELGWYLRYRAMVEEVTRSTVIMVAAEGSTENLPWSVLRTTPGPDGGGSVDWNNYGSRQLRKLCGRIPAQAVSGGAVVSGAPENGPRCQAPPQMVCTPDDMYDRQNTTNRVECRATFSYRTLTSAGRSPLLSFGFNGLFARPIVIDISSFPSVVEGRY